MSVIASSSLSTDQEKFLASQLISRTMLKLVCAQACEKVALPQGAGLTAYFVRYKRMNVPVATLSETGSDPSSSSFSIDGANVTLDQWGDVLEVTDVAILATAHPLMQQLTELLSDNAQRVIDREIQIVWLSGTNVQYGDGSVSSRATITSALKMTSGVLHKARITLSDGGAPPRDGPSSNAANDAKQVGQIDSVRQGRHYLAICGPQVMGDIQTEGTALGTWAAVAMYANAKALYNAEVGTWLGFRFVETNFIPKFTLLGNTTTAVVSAATIGTGGPTVTASTDNIGSLKSSTTFYFKVTRKDLLRGFEEAISIAHSMASAATGDTESFLFAMPSTTGYVYNIYFDSNANGGSGTDATLLLSTYGTNVAASGSVSVLNIGTGAAAPANTRASNDGADPGTVHVVYCIGAEFCNWVTLQNLQFMVSKDESTVGNVLRLKRQAGYKFMSKTMIRDNSKALRIEIASSY